jgi:hypothetical protein
MRDREYSAERGGTYPKREMTAIIERTTPVMMRPILAPEVILTCESSKRSGRVSIADGRGQDKRGQE